MDELANFVLLSDKDKARLLGRFVADPALGGAVPLLGPQPPGPAGDQLAGREIEEAAVAEVERWAFRLFALPEDARGLLPILDEKGVEKPEVDAETFDEVRELANAAVPGQIREAVRGIGLAAATGRLTVTLERLRKLSDARTVTMFVNRELHPVEADIDLERGLVRFRQPVGHIVGVEDLNTAARAQERANDIARGSRSKRVRDFDAKAQARLAFAPRVRITFSYEDSSAARASLKRLGRGEGLADPASGPGETQYHFSFLAGLGKDGGLQHLNPRLVDPAGAEKLFPLVIHDESFRLVLGLDGRTHDVPKVALDERAREIARQLLAGPEEVGGEEGVAFGFFPIETSSVISQVSWEAAAGKTETRWSLQNATRGNLRFNVRRMG